MRWYMLRDRRHEGPFTKEQIVEAIKAGTIDPRDYLLPEIAEKDHGSFAYISAADVVGPEALYDIKNKSENAGFKVRPPQQEGGYTVAGSSPVQPSEVLRSEFEDGLESTQLIRLKKAQTGGASNLPPPPAFVSQPGGGGPQFPWKIVGIVVVVVGLLAAAVGPVMNMFSSEKAIATDTRDTPVSVSRPSRPRQNRLPTGNMNLPTTERNSEESDYPDVSKIPKDDPIEISPRRKKRPRVRDEEPLDRERPEDGPDEGSDVENSFDEDEVVDEYEAEEDEPADEADI